MVTVPTIQTLNVRYKKYKNYQFLWQIFVLKCSQNWKLKWMLKHSVSVMWISTHQSHSSHWCPLQVQEEDSSTTMNVNFTLIIFLHTLCAIWLPLESLRNYLISYWNSRIQEQCPDCGPPGWLVSSCTRLHELLRLLVLCCLLYVIIKKTSK